MTHTSPELRSGPAQTDDGAVRVSDPSDHQTDFGRVARSRPSLVVHARNEADVVAALSIARDRGLSIRMRGTGHSCHGQSLITDGLLLVNDDHDDDSLRLLDGARVDIPARVHWRRVDRFLKRVGRAVPVLPDYLDMSVGGTMSVGGYGVDSIRHGAQVDLVDRLRLILPDGDALWCSPTERPDLFGFALSGQGHVGIIERVVMRTVPYRPFTTMFVYRHPSFEALVDSLAGIAEADDAHAPLFKAVITRGTFSSCYGFTSTSLADAVRMPPPTLMAERRVGRRWISWPYRPLRSLSVKLWVGSFGQAFRRWSDYIFTHAGLVAFEAFLRELLARDAFGGCLKSTYILAIRQVARPVALPFDAMTGLAGSMGFGIGLYSMVPKNRPDLVERVAAASRLCLERCLQLGGRPYRYGCHDVDVTMSQSIYGDTRTRLIALRRDLDPGGMLGPVHL